VVTKTITIKDVAKVAGVSTATVSRALSNPDSVTASTRNQVLKAASDTGYQINIAARNLRSQKTGAIVVFVPGLSNPFFSHILAGIEAEAAIAEKSVEPTTKKVRHWLWIICSSWATPLSGM